MTPLYLGVVIRGDTDFEFHLDEVQVDPIDVFYDGNGGPPSYQGKPALIGASGGFGRYEGELDEVRFFNRDLTLAEIQAVPEPGALLGLVSGIAVLAAIGRTRMRL